MKIIGHRGAGGLALENTIESIKAGVRSGADLIELDVRMTKDNKLVLSHEANLKKTYDVDLTIAHHTLKELRIPLPHLTTLEEALQHIPNGAILDIKEFIQPERIFKITKKFPDLDIRYASFNHHMLKAIKKYSPGAYCYALEHHSPFDILNTATKLKADGIGIHYAILNPLTYYLARRKNLSIYVYWLDKEWIARLYSFLYKDIDICTDYPQQMIKVRDGRER